MNRIVAALAALAIVAAAAPFAGPFVILLLAQILVLGIVAMSVDLLLGYTGLPSLGQAAYLGVGAYLTAILATKFGIGLGWDFWLVVALGMLSGAATAALFGLFAVRASGVYFLMITLALGMCVWGLAYRWNSLTGGDNGINMRGRPRFGIQLADDLTFFYVVLGFFVASLAALHLLVNSPFGRSLVGIRERELRMRILGYNTWLHKYIAFVVAGAFGGLAGVLWAHLNGIVSPSDVLLPASVDALLMVVLGGPGTLVPWWQYVLGAVYVLTILFLPNGLMGFFKGGKA
jgi:branched-chain amino acid transport system permease protein